MNILILVMSFLLSFIFGIITLIFISLVIDDIKAKGKKPPRNYGTSVDIMFSAFGRKNYNGPTFGSIFSTVIIALITLFFISVGVSTINKMVHVSVKVTTQ